MLRLITAVSFFLAVAGMLAVDLVSWTRTAPIRRGDFPPRCDVPGDRSVAVARSSRTTMLAAVAGGATTAWGAAGAGAGSGAIVALPMVAFGASIAIAGSVARVTAIAVNDYELVVSFAARRPFRARWADIHGLGPPATPVGGWRVSVAGGRGRTLMPSDLFGHEDVLAAIVGRARLGFDGRRWVRTREVSRRGW